MGKNMGRASVIAILALLVSGVAACTNSPDDFGGGSSGGVRARKSGTNNTASGEIEGEAQTPSEEPLSGSDPAANGNDGDGDEATPPADPNTPDPDPGPGADPNPNPNPGPDPIPTGSYAVGTQLVTTANLNIRDGADTSYAILTTAPKGSTVVVQTVSGAGGWVNISWNGTVGWSSKAYLTAQ